MRERVRIAVAPSRVEEGEVVEVVVTRASKVASTPARKVALRDVEGLKSDARNEEGASVWETHE